MDTQLDTSQLPNLPVISRKRFADLVGVSEDTVNGWITKGMETMGGVLGGIIQGFELKPSH